LAQAGNDIVALNYALSSNPGRLVLYIPTAKGFVFSQLASLRAPVVSEVAAQLQKDGYLFVTDRNLVITQRVVDVRTVDSFALQPEIMKIDVEGNELEVLEGAGETLERTRPILLIENGARDEIIQYLTSFGYNPFSYDVGRDTLYPLQEESVNTFFISTSHSN
jgi:FkbM family methyltransferase